MKRDAKSASMLDDDLKQLLYDIDMQAFVEEFEQNPQKNTCQSAQTPSAQTSSAQVIQSQASQAQTEQNNKASPPLKIMKSETPKPIVIVDDPLSETEKQEEIPPLKEELKQETKNQEKPSKVIATWALLTSIIAALGFLLSQDLEKKTAVVAMTPETEAVSDALVADAATDENKVLPEAEATAVESPKKEEAQTIATADVQAVDIQEVDTQLIDNQVAGAEICNPLLTGPYSSNQKEQPSQKEQTSEQSDDLEKRQECPSVKEAPVLSIAEIDAPPRVLVYKNTTAFARPFPDLVILKYKYDLNELLQKRKNRLSPIAQELSVLLSSHAKVGQDLFDKQCDLLFSRYKAQDARYSFEISKQITHQIDELQRQGMAEKQKTYSDMLISLDAQGYNTLQFDDLKSALTKQFVFTALQKRYSQAQNLQELSLLQKEVQTLFDKVQKSPTTSAFFDLDARKNELKCELSVQLNRLLFQKPENRSFALCTPQGRDCLLQLTTNAAFTTEEKSHFIKQFDHLVQSIALEAAQKKKKEMQSLKVKKSLFLPQIFPLNGKSKKYKTQ